jgi:hypothetical protein
LVFLLGTRAIQEGGKTRYEFVHPPEVVRKAASDILQWAGIGLQSKEGSPATVRWLEGTIFNPKIEERALRIAQPASSIQEKTSAKQE